MKPEAPVEQLLAADPIDLAGRSFVAIFAHVELGQEVSRQKVMNWLVQEFGKWRWTPRSNRAYEAVIREIELIYEQARVASRRSSGTLVLLPRGVRLGDAPDPVTALRELL